MIRILLFISLLISSASAQSNCHDPGLLIDQRSSEQQRADSTKQRLRCVSFVLTDQDPERLRGWVAWHHHRSDGLLHSERLGLMSVPDSQAHTFGRIPEPTAQAEPLLRITVLLPAHRWWLVNTTRHGWQLRSGTVRDPDMETLAKLFTDVAINAGIAKPAQQIRDWWPRGAGRNSPWPLSGGY